MNISSCGVHGFGEVIGIDVDEIRVFWKLDIKEEHSTQVAYRVAVSESKDGGQQGHEHSLYDSGRIESNEQRNILCRPNGGFASTTFYYWTVTVWAQDGTTATSQVNEFYTSYPKSSRLLPPYSMNQTYVRSELTACKVSSG